MLRFFAYQITFRIAAILAAALALAWGWKENSSHTIFASGAVLLWIAASLYRLTTGVNRKLARFFDAVQYNDFASAFRADNSFGPSFQAVNQRFNAVLEEFRQARAEREANFQYLQTVVQHVNVGLIVCDAQGKVELINQATLRLLGIYRLKHRNDLEKNHSELAALLKEPQQRSSKLIQLANGQQLTCQGAAIRLRGRWLHLVSFQNIRSELQQKEVEAWQNLTRVLRHEIMNSVTPLVTLVGTMKAIVEEDLAEPEKAPGAIDDLKSALDIVEKRGRGIMRFVEAYRSFSNLPQPSIAPIQLFSWLERVIALSMPDLKARHIVCELECYDKTLQINGDSDQLEMVLLNVIKNAAEALGDKPDGWIKIKAFAPSPQQVVLEISDNGAGIPEEFLEHIFIPFFTTKSDGNGIGLSLSKQIIAMHGGGMQVFSEKGKGTTVRIGFE